MLSPKDITKGGPRCTLSMGKTSVIESQGYLLSAQGGDIAYRLSSEVAHTHDRWWADKTGLCQRKKERGRKKEEEKQFSGNGIKKRWEGGIIKDYAPHVDFVEPVLARYIYIYASLLPFGSSHSAAYIYHS